MTDVIHRPWHCDPNAIACEQRHQLWLNKAAYREDRRNTVGHSFLQCKTCNPPSYFLAVFTRDPSPLVLCYALSKESYDEWNNRPGLTPATAELLYLLRDPQGRSHHPNYKPPR